MYHVFSFKLMKNRKADSSADLMADYSELVRNVMAKNDFTQAELAIRLGVKQPMISLYLNRKQTPSVRILEEIRQLAGGSQGTVINELPKEPRDSVQEGEDIVEPESQRQQLAKTYWLFGVAPWNWDTTMEKNLWG